MNEPLNDDRYCFACGEKNPIGMKLKFMQTEEGLEAKYVFPREFQGYRGVAHGGLIALLLDEIVVNLPWLKYKKPVVSADLRIKLKKRLLTGEPVTVRAVMMEERSKAFRIRGEVIRDSDNAVIADAEVLCVKVKVED